jgi:hypothetical protein
MAAPAYQSLWLAMDEAQDFAEVFLKVQLRWVQSKATILDTSYTWFVAAQQSQA